MKPIEKVCPACNAQPGYPCTTPSDKVRRPVSWTHFAREVRDEDEEREEEDR